MDQAQILKKEREDWTRAYHKMLKEIETMIDMQRMLKDIKKIAKEANTTITEVEGSILIASINNRNKCYEYRTNIQEPSISSSK